MSADLLARLIEAGTPAALVAEVAMLVARADASGDALEKRRASDRERSTRRRHVTSRDVTGDSVTTRDVTDEPPPSPSPSLPPHPQPNPAPTRPHVGDAGTHEAPTRKVGKYPVPDGCAPDDWRDLLANRKSKRLPMTDAAYRKLLRDLAEQSDDEWPPGRVLAHAAERGWAAIFDPREAQGHRRDGNRPTNDRSEPQNPMVRAVRRAEARDAGREGAGVQPRLHT